VPRRVTRIDVAVATRSTALKLEAGGTTQHLPCKTFGLRAFSPARNIVRGRAVETVRRKITRLITR
jgi:hypothetical protein